MDPWLIFFSGFVFGLALGLRFWWGQRRRRIEAEKLLQTPLGKLVTRR
jgi:hypothetical protein